MAPVSSAVTHLHNHSTGPSTEKHQHQCALGLRLFQLLSGVDGYSFCRDWFRRQVLVSDGSVKGQLQVMVMVFRYLKGGRRIRSMLCEVKGKNQIQMNV